MSPPGKKSSANKKVISSNAAFLGFTVAGLSFAIIMIILGRVAVSGSLPQNPITTTIAAAPTKTSTSTPTAPITTISTPTTPITTISTPTTPITSTQTTPSLTTTVTTPNSSLPLASVSKGLLTAPVTFIQYTDFQCAHCQQFTLTVEPQLEAAYVDTGKVRFIHKFINAYENESFLANQAAACAAEQGKFWEYYYLLMAQRASPSKDDLPLEKLQELAQQIGLDIDKFNASLLSGKYEAYVMQDDEEGRALGITGTPTFFINGIKKNGAKTLQELAEIIDPMLQ